MIISILLLLVGLAVLIIGAEGLVRGAGSVSRRAGIPPIAIGLMIVAFGTSAPELIVSVLAAFKGSSEIAIGNVVGSNIVNILFILGTSALIVNLKVLRNTTWKEIPFALLAVICILIMSGDMYFDGTSSNMLSRTDGFILLAFFCIFMYYIVDLVKNEVQSNSGEEIAIYSVPLSIAFTIGGLLCLFLEVS